MPTDERIDPYRGFNFLVEIDNTEVAGFSEVTGLNAELGMVEYREGSDAENHTRKLTCLSKYGDVSLKRGYTRDDTLWRWWASLIAGADDRRSVSVTLLDEAHEPVMRWLLEGAWIKTLQAPSFNASGNEVVIEALDLFHEKLTIELEG